MLDIRDAHGDLKAVAEAANSLEQDNVDLLYTVATSVTIEARRSTVTTPIVFNAGSDPTIFGLVEKLCQPRWSAHRCTLLNHGSHGKPS